MLSDAELVRRCRQGQQAAFAELVERYEKKVYNLAYRMLGDGEEARDLAQEAFLKAYYALPDFRGESTFSTWLYRITTNLCLDVLRRRKNNIAFSLDEPLQTEKGALARQLPAEGEGPEGIVERQELRQLIQRLIDTLPPEQRLVLVMREFQDLTYEEIAAALQCSLGTVKSRLSRARRALKEKLLASGEPFGSSLRQKQGKGGSRV
ncbi:MAG TPA: sigma-70 family RNA polymerase sigma factor [Firmicutes bacterium]|nr:sigma-70 family RNA polymerase sigma factor [Bacillota bacterium]